MQLFQEHGFFPSGNAHTFIKYCTTHTAYRQHRSKVKNKPIAAQILTKMDAIDITLFIRPMDFNRGSLERYKTNGILQYKYKIYIIVKKKKRNL